MEHLVVGDVVGTHDDDGPGRLTRVLDGVHADEGVAIEQ